jgi:Ca2+/Na+ antiporter
MDGVILLIFDLDFVIFFIIIILFFLYCYAIVVQFFYSKNNKNKTKSKEIELVIIIFNFLSPKSPSETKFSIQLDPLCLRMVMSCKCENSSLIIAKSENVINNCIWKFC